MFTQRNIFAVHQLVILAMLPGSDSGFGTGRPAFPERLHGIWFSSDSNGAALCTAFRQTDKSDADNLSNHLIGSVVISHSLIHDNAEYGEGNFYQLRQFERVQHNHWIAHIAGGIDSIPDVSQPVDMIFAMQLSNRKLIMKSLPISMDSTGSQQTRFDLFRCVSYSERARQKEYRSLK